MIILKVSYQVRAHNIARYEEIFSSQVLPIVRDYGMRFRGIWKSLVGSAGEYFELWEFDSAAEFEKQWKKLMSDARLREVFQSTGPLVEAETLSLFEPALSEFVKTHRDMLV